MSYDVWIEVRKITAKSDVWRCVEEDAPGNYTSNVAGMWAKALGFSLAILKGTLCRDALPYLDRAVAHMRAFPYAYLPMNPPNGWGNFDGALLFLDRLREMCRKYPDGRIEMWF